MSDILARMKLKTHASDAGGSVGGGSAGGSVGESRLVGIRGGGGGTSYATSLLFCSAIFFNHLPR